jgi:hypothetical protein
MPDERHMTVDELLVELSAAVDAGDFKRGERLLKWARRHLTPEDHARIAAFTAQKAAAGGEMAEFAEEGADAVSDAMALMLKRGAPTFGQLLEMDLTSEERLSVERAHLYLRGD